jgi:mRNA interferase YafQ
MKRVRHAGQFQKDLRLAQRRGLNLTRLATVIDLLIAGHPLPPAKRDHPLKGEWKGFRECHIAPDWLLIYRDIGEEIQLARTGTHADLFG